MTWKREARRAQFVSRRVSQKPAQKKGPYFNSDFEMQPVTWLSSDPIATAT